LHVDEPAHTVARSHAVARGSAIFNAGEAREAAPGRLTCVDIIDQWRPPLLFPILRAALQRRPQAGTPHTLM